MIIRTATQNDLNSIVEIYNQAINSKFETAEITEVTTADKKDWFAEHNPDVFPIFVYETDGKIAGWLSISPYRKGREALRFTVEISYYIHNDFKRQGIGTKLIEYALNAGKDLGYKTFVAIILEKNQASINLLKKFDFEQWAHLPDVADFDGELCGHIYLGRKI